MKEKLLEGKLVIVLKAHSKEELLGKAIATLRASLGLSRAKLAAMCGTNRWKVERVEVTGSRLDVEIEPDK